MSNNLDYIIHPNKELIKNKFFGKSNIEHFYEGPQGNEGEMGLRGLKGDRGLRGSEGPAGPPGPAGKGFTEDDIAPRTLWCLDDSQCQTSKNVTARFRDNSVIKIGPNLFGDSSLVLGSGETGEAAMYTAFGDMYIDGSNAKEGKLEPGATYINKNNKGKTFINEQGSDVLINDRSGYTGINMQGTAPKNFLHIKGDRALTVENVNQSAGSAGVLLKDNRSGQDFTLGVTDFGLYIRDDKEQKFSFVTKNGTTGIGTKTPNENYCLDVAKVARFKDDVRMTGGSDVSLQINMSKTEGDRKNMKNSEINKGLEVMGGDVERSKIRFFGGNLDFDIGPTEKTLLNLNRDGVNFEGPTNFKDVVTMSGPKEGSDDNTGIVIKNDSKFEGNSFHDMNSYWGEKGLGKKYTHIQNNLITTNNGVQLVSVDDDTKFTNLTFDKDKQINNGEPILNVEIANGALVVKDNLVVEGTGQESKGIETDGIKAAVGQIDQIRTLTEVKFSDQKMKEDIKEIDQQSNMNKLLQMNGYQYINKITKENDIGVIAQQIEKIAPDLVDNNGKLKGVKYSNIIPMLLEGIKYQQKEINELKKKINN